MSTELEAICNGISAERVHSEERRVLLHTTNHVRAVGKKNGHGQEVSSNKRRLFGFMSDTRIDASNIAVWGLGFNNSEGWS